MQPSTTSRLWDELSAFPIDAADARMPFTVRLARDNGWTTMYAGRVVEEYRRFLYLAVSAGHPVTPSDEVDQAWHLHLLYTRSYWDDLCGGVLKRPLHHEPTKGGAREGEKFNDWYEATLASYRQAFGRNPPSDIWPDPTVRFDARRRFIRVDAGSNWVVRKPGPRPFLMAGLMLVVVTAVSCAATASEDASTLMGILAAVLLLFFLISRGGGRGSMRRGKTGRGGEGIMQHHGDGGDSHDGGHHNGSFGGAGSHGGWGGGDGHSGGDSTGHGCGGSGCGSGCGGSGCGGH